MHLSIKNVFLIGCSLTFSNLILFIVMSLFLFSDKYNLSSYISISKRTLCATGSLAVFNQKMEMELQKRILENNGIFT
jgi:hypothetical protein